MYLWYKWLKKGFTLELNSTRSDVFEMLMRINYPKTLTFVSIVAFFALF